MASVVEEFGPFDFILNDGSHRCSHMIASLNSLFDADLASGGIDVAKDTRSNYCPIFRDRAGSFIDLAKDLVDLMHAHHVTQPSETMFRMAHPMQAVKGCVPRICTQLGEIHFSDSMVRIHKSASHKAPTSVVL